MSDPLARLEALASRFEKIADRLAPQPTMNRDQPCADPNVVCRVCGSRPGNPCMFVSRNKGSHHE